MNKFFTSPLRNQTKPVFLYKNHTIYGAKFTASVNSLAALLSQSSKNKWAIFSADTFLFAIGFFALLKARKTIILPHNIQAETLNNLDAEAFLFDDEIIPHQENPAQTNLQSEEINPNSKIIFLTSGSGGTPKLINKNFGNLQMEVKDLLQQFGEDFLNKTFIATVNHQHIYGLIFKLLLPLKAGNLINSHLTETFEELANFQDAVLISSPAFLKRLPQNAEIPNMKVFSSGGLLKLDDAKNCASIFGDFPIEILGSTETGGIAYRRQKDGQIWHKFAAVEIKNGTENYLMVKSPYVFGDEFIATGDAAELLDDGTFLLKGRIDRIVKIEEKRISLNEIENNLLKHSFISSSYAIILDSSKRQIIGMAAQLSQDGENFLKENSKSELNSILRQHLLQYFEAIIIPRKWRFVKNIPINSQGKILVNEIKDLFKNENSNH
ncbi:MAG: acyl-coenzyme A synthetase/AMP-(fatty) acid ligase [Rickettsiales bacterium]|jgi:acyl-coenzyme A synthetase/AMP-(fatty) acid ligase